MFSAGNVSTLDGFPQSGARVSLPDKARRDIFVRTSKMSSVHPLRVFLIRYLPVQ